MIDQENNSEHESNRITALHKNSYFRS